MEQEYIAQTALDQMVGTETVQLLKAAVPYLPPRGQQILSLYAKIQELSGTLALFSSAGHRTEMSAAAVPAADPMEMLGDIRRFCYGSSRRRLDQMVNMLAMVQVLQVMNTSGDAPESHNVDAADQKGEPDEGK